MLSILKKHIVTVAGLFIGLAGGWLYWYFVGCADGSCAIQSDPLNMTLYGGVMGGLLGNLVQDSLRRK